MTDQQKYHKTAKAHRDLEAIVGKYRELKQVNQGIADATGMLTESDAELAAMAQEELTRLQSRGADILRMKGVLNLKGESRRFVFHGVHMMFDGQLERPWNADSPRLSRLVFIGRNLDRHELEAGFESCVA